jgi:hypothetical protein
VLLLGFGWRDVSDGLQKPSMIEPIDPFQGCEFHRLEIPPWPAPMNDLGLVEAVDCFSEGVVVAVTNAANGRLDARLGQSLRIFDRDVLGSFNRSPRSE